jgi:hypothetical protein
MINKKCLSIRKSKIFLCFNKINERKKTKIQRKNQKNQGIFLTLKIHFSIILLSFFISYYIYYIIV